ncbi:unnamed protein product [Didymodactylos carnosus]|uniref:G-protein coupled receptors family 1 profile domain-containing protein n=1 Tax=Didymodactylos carnosus TaxID=1234261 RepID=A0A813TEW5_9BILA|nr:unnamed protein product [Didymodactylos carnosus]CAF1347968.1 unnamed protein product [Didymodactylos carnosus]CAF3592854.1 unnamed protein product [Didymodactylos carnosus]CAF4158761.1 unnamed protein product [Didymodactylos carnosus]
MTTNYQSTYVNVLNSNNTSNLLPVDIMLRQTKVRELIIGILVRIITPCILGNVIVVTAICRVQRLRHPTNYILMSLAIADLLVTTTVMIPGLVYNIKQKWIFGAIFCKIWVSNDITFCTASILHLVAVSIDRFVAIENPLRYKQKMTSRTIFIIIGCIWLISVLLSYGPVMLGLYSFGNAQEYLQDKSECGMRPNRIYSIISSLTSFYIPLIIILALYARIFITARKHSLELQKLENIIKRLHSNEQFVLESSKWKRDAKAIRTLGIVVGVFIICWLPFFIMYLRLAYCDYECITPFVEHLITWIGYANSFCNPVIYAFSNKDFRNAFFEILHYNHNCRCFPLLINADHSSKVRTSLTKSNYSMTSKYTPPFAQSRQASVIPPYRLTNGLIYSSSINNQTNDDNNKINSYKMQIMGEHSKNNYNHNNYSIDQYDSELDHLVPNGGGIQKISHVRMSSLLYDQDDTNSFTMKI